jgi:hypothetical protein
MAGIIVRGSPMLRESLKKTVEFLPDLNSVLPGKGISAGTGGNY